MDEEDGDSKILLIGPGPNNTLGLRPGEVEVFNQLGSVILDVHFYLLNFLKIKPHKNLLLYLNKI